VTAGPEWILRTLVGALERYGDDQDGQPVDYVELHFPPSTENRADRQRLHAFPGELRVVLRIGDHGKNMADIAIAVRTADTFHERPLVDIGVLSHDNDLAFVVRHYAGRSNGGRRVQLLHAHPRPPSIFGRKGTSRLTRRLDLGLEGPGLRRPWTEWDSAAWTLRRLAGFTSDRIAANVLHPGSGADHAQRWEATERLVGTDWDRLEQVDNLVADLWRLGRGRPLARPQALDEVVRRLGGGGATTREALAAMEALLVAQLLRSSDPEHVEVPSSWREGLLLPIRRIVLRLASRAQFSDTRTNLEQRHRRKFLPGSGASSDLDSNSSSDSWAWVSYALRHRLQAVVEKTKRPSRDDATGRTQQRWILQRTPFTIRTVSTAHRIRAMLDELGRDDDLETELEAAGIHRASRWLRSLQDVGLIRPRGDGGWVSVDRHVRVPAPGVDSRARYQ
jgi:hypothetical protein